MTEMSRDYSKADLQFFKDLDRQLSEKMQEHFKDGSYLAVLAAVLHSSALRDEDHQIKNDLNVLESFCLIKDNPDMELSPETILAIYAAGQKGKTAGWKQTNCWVEYREGVYITASAEETPQVMEELCKKYSFLNHPVPEQFDEIFRFILDFICIHPFQDGNGRMAALLMQFLLQKAGLKSAVYLPVDLVMNGAYMNRTGEEIRKASGVFCGMKEMEYDGWIVYMKEVLTKSCEIMRTAVGMIESEA